jgi:putative transposase
MHLTALTPKVFAFSLPNSEASVMGLAGVGCWNIQDWNTCNRSFVSSELFQLIASPTVQVAALRFPDLCRFADAGQVLKRQCCIQLLGFLYQLFRDVVVNPLLELPIPPREPFQEAFCPLCAFGLNRSSNLDSLLTSRLHLPTRPGFSGAGMGNVFLSYVYPNHFWSLSRWRSIQLDCEVDVVITLPSLIYGYFWRWSKDGTWLKVHDKLYQWVRVAAGREPSPSEAAVDSQSVETATMISIDVGYDAGKKIHGRKRHLSVDMLGLVLRVLVTSASLPEREGAKKVLQRVHDTGHQVKRLNTIWMDGGYRGEEFMHWVMDMFRWIVTIVLRPLEKKGFVHLPKRWVVERTFGWLNWCRRLSKDYERLPETSDTFIYIAMIRLMVRRLA